jgi:16S rRNA (guanine966-N2)-methyltransferase
LTNSLKIIGGTHRGRKFNFPDVASLRPTPNKIRETLFNWIQFEIQNKTFLDLFTGSGSLSFEALSRGAKQIIGIEKNKIAFQSLEQNRKNLKSDKINFINTDALNFISQKSTQKFDFILLDPPFHQQLLEKTLKLLSSNGFLISGCKIYCESEFKITKQLLIKKVSQKTKINQQKYSGQVHYCLIEIL